ncbi:pectinesterase family protein [Actinopolymorpha sp. B11F2]|uniref:pectinesterase family protein n=1 Tax=Actinopolymorpha sp. B11F2 TaxID=3160862 RepID=UPI0032E38AEE
MGMVAGFTAVIVLVGSVLALPGTSSAPEPAMVSVAPHGLAQPACADTSLRMTFPEPVQLGSGGRLTVHRADGTVADVVDLADPASRQRTIGGARSDFGQLHLWNYEPVVVEGRTVSVYLHARLDAGQLYYVTVDDGFVAGFPGIHSRTAWQFRTKHDPPAGSTTLTVDATGGADFCTVQGAIDFVPEGNDRPVRIDVAEGTYREIVYVPQTKPHLRIVGANRDRTVIAYPNNNVLNGDIAMASVPPEQSYCPRRVLPIPDRFNCWRAAVGVDADDFLMQDITVHNLTPKGGSQAEAFRGNGERIVLSGVRLLSFQDTLRLQGKAYVTNSYIEGDVDFIWGTGGVFLEKSELKAMSPGYYVQSRNLDGQPGYVFADVRLTRAPDVPDESLYLARAELARFPTSQVVFIDAAMDSHVRAVGWQVFQPGDCGAATQVRLWEYGSTDLSGDPVDTSQRLACSRQLTDDEAAALRDPSTVLGGWDPRADLRADSSTDVVPARQERGQ